MRIITKEFLRLNPLRYFVFGDNLLHQGYGGAAALRDCKNAYGFVTKKYPTRQNEAHYKPEEYKFVYEQEIIKLKSFIMTHPGCFFIVSRLGSGLANRYGIFEKVIQPNIKKDLTSFNNVEFLW